MQMSACRRAYALLGASMTKTPEAIIEPELLVWARRSSGLELDAAATKMGVTSDRLRSWEAGEARPTIAQLRQAAKAYKRPLAIFYLPEPPADFQPLRDYRRLPDAEVGILSPQLHASIRRARSVREAALELRELADDPIADPPRLEIQARDPEQFGAAARELLAVTLDRQVSWLDPGRALNGWIDAISRLDVLVLQVQRIPTEEMRGFSISADRLPMIVLNGADFPRGRIFTLLHEFAHILLHAEGVCDVLPRQQAQRPTDETEIFCNQVAAATLMPADVFRADVARLPAPSDGRWSEDALAGLSMRYSVSQESVVRRLYTFGLTDWNFLQEKQAEYRRGYEEYREQQKRERSAAENPGGPTFYRMKVRDLGRGFIESALDAYYRRAITGSDLSEYLEIKLNQVPKLEAEMALTGGAHD
jgi:Zn-dependent peptidase ImmA (M78 family)/transcriptional regulator with XRE-family HTH domain